MYSLINIFTKCSEASITNHRTSCESELPEFSIPVILSTGICDKVLFVSLSMVGVISYPNKLYRIISIIGFIYRFSIVYKIKSDSQSRLHGSWPFLGFDWYYSTIPLNGSCHTKCSPETVLYDGRQAGSFVNHAVSSIL